MKTRKSLASALATIAVVSAIGFSYAQTTGSGSSADQGGTRGNATNTTPSVPGTTNTATPGSTMTPAPSTSTTTSTPPSTTTTTTTDTSTTPSMSTTTSEPPVRAARN